MLMQSYSGRIYLLPALPPAWRTGRVEGLRARGGFSLDIDWRNGELHEATIQRVAPGTLSQSHDGPARLHYRGQSLELTPRAKGIVKVRWIDSRLVAL